jgi:hypothetical protein
MQFHYFERDSLRFMHNGSVITGTGDYFKWQYLALASFVDLGGGRHCALIHNLGERTSRLERLLCVVFSFCKGMKFKDLWCFGSEGLKTVETDEGVVNYPGSLHFKTNSHRGADVVFAYSSRKADGLAQVHLRRAPDSRAIPSTRLVPIPESCSSSVMDLTLATDGGDDLPMVPVELSRDLFSRLAPGDEKEPHEKPVHPQGRHRAKIYAVKLNQLFMGSSSLNFCSRHLCRLNSESFVHLKKLSCLQLCCNNLKTLPREIGLLRRLTTLVLSNNQLDELPETIGFLVSLVELRVDKNRLTDLPRTMSGLQALRVLSIADNMFSEIPRCVMPLTRLTTFECDRNPLRGIPAEIVRFSQLQRFHVDDCPRLLKEDGFPAYEREHSRVGPTSLLEASARSLVRHRKPVMYSLPLHLREYLSRAEECAYCCGPMFECRVLRCRMIRRMERYIPVIQHLCTNHWTSERERRVAILSSYPRTMPPHLVSTDLRDLKGSLAPFNRYDPFLVARSRRLLSKYPVEERLELLIPLSMSVVWPEYPRPQ